MEDNNNIERFFNQKFNQNIEPEEWNIPDKEVWLNVYSNLEKNKKNNKNFWMIPILISSLIMSILLGLFLLEKHNELQGLQLQLKECSESFKTISIDTSTKNTNLVSSNILSDNENNHLSKANQKVNLNKNINHFIKKESKPKTKNIESSLSNQNNTLNSNYINPIDSSSKTSMNNIVLVSHSKLKPERIIDPLINRKNYILEFEREKLQLNKWIIEPEKNNKHYWLGISSGIVVWNDLINGAFSNPLSELLIKESTKPSFIVGANIMKQVNRNFSISAGINHYSRVQKSFFELNLPYSTLSETTASIDKLHNTFQHSLPTGLGEISTNLVLARNINSPVTNNENVYLDFSFENISSAINIPLTLAYYPKEVGYGLFLTAGIQNEIILKTAINKIEAISHHSFVKEESVNINYESSQISSFNFRASVGAGYQIPINNYFDIMLAGTYGLALSDSYSTTSFKHKIQNFSTQLTILHKL